MKALVITSSFPRDTHDIAGDFVLEHACALQAQGIQVQILTWADQDVGDTTLRGVDVTRVSYAPKRHRRLFYGAGAPENLSAVPLRALLAPPAIASMTASAMVRAHRFDVIIGHWWLPGGLIARQVGRLARKPTAVIGHSGGVHLMGKLPALVQRSLARSIGRGPVSVTTSTLAQKARSMGVNPTVLPMGFTRTGATASGRDWMFMGRLEPIKGIPSMLQATRGIEGILRIAGRGSLSGLVDAHVSEKVAALGWVRGDAKGALLSRSRFGLFPSSAIDGRHEGLPVSLLECADAGVIPIVATVPGVEPYLVDVSLQKLPTDDREWPARLKALEQLSEAELDRLSAAQRERVAHLEWTVLGETWADWVRSATTWPS